MENRGLKKVCVLSFLFLLILTVVPLGTVLAIQSADEGSAKLIEAAKKEGNFSWYTTLNVRESDILLRKLSFLGLLKHYPQLIDANKGIVTQKEHTIIITEEGCEVIT